MDELPDHEITTGPLTYLAEEVGGYLWHSVSVDFPPDLLWPSLLMTLVLATALFWYRGGLGSRGADGRARKAGYLQFLFPRDIYTHVSARVDIAIWLLGRLLRPIWIVVLLATVGPATEQWVMGTLDSVFGATPALQSNLAWMLLYSLVALLLYDFVFYLTHLAMHKFPSLWALHKVHHSAEVLTPLTRHREHFLAAPLWAAGSSFSYALAAGVFAYLFAGDIVEATVMNIGFFTLVFGFTGTFRHYHIQFRYPRWLEKWLQSPAMHHVHHSYLPQHRDTNLAAVTSIYDRLFGTLYLPETDEYTPWGLAGDEQRQTRSFWQNTLAPFQDWRDLIRARLQRKPSSVSQVPREP